MADTRHAVDELRVSNVTLHSRGRKQDGSLRLTKHHLIFSYSPSEAERGPQPANGGPQDAHTEHSAADGRRSASRDGHGNQDAPSSQKTRAPAKPRLKEIWIPYPMISHCVLRPGHTQGPRATHAEPLRQDQSTGADHATFPPVYGTNPHSRLYTDSTHLSSPGSPRRSASPVPDGAAHVLQSSRAPAIRLRRRDFQMMAIHFNPSSSPGLLEDTAREVFYRLRSICCVEEVQSMHAFHFHPPPQELAASGYQYEPRREFARMGIGCKTADGPGSSWRLSDINCDYTYSPTYPAVLCVPDSVSDNTLKYGGAFRSKHRIPVLTYLHSNGGSITRAAQPLVGIQSKRSPQDERLVTAIFSSHTLPQPSALDGAPEPLDRNNTPRPSSDVNQLSSGVASITVNESELESEAHFPETETVVKEMVYGSTRRNIIIDARPRVNALANRATGGGIEDVANYSGPNGGKVERVFLNIPNIHVMRKSLEKVVDSFANSDYLDLKPNQELLRNSGWLAHVANMLDGAEMVARAVGLGGSHVLLHCSDGWDRTSQVAALSEIMLDPHYRTLPGFITLVQKDFVSFGHKFNHRLGIQGSEKWFEIENERVMPSQAKDGGNTDTTGLNKALNGAKSWFEKNRATLFSQPNDSKGSLDDLGSRESSPAPNPLVHSSATSNSKDDKERKTDIKEIAPIFHQFLDAVFQLHLQHPHAFQFNERFLRRLFYQAHAGQYGEFLFNNEKSRLEHRGEFCSVWPHFLSRREEFTNSQYSARAEDVLLFPKRQLHTQAPDVRWWSALFGRNDEDMNNAHTLAPADAELSLEAPLPQTEATKDMSAYSTSTATSREAPEVDAPSGVNKPSPAYERSSQDDRVKEVNGRNVLDVAAFARDSAFSDM